MFRTSFDIQESKTKINLQDPIVLMGSCFSENIGTLLSSNKFNTLTNPYGIIYNPISINKLLIHSIENSFVDYHLFGNRDDIHFHYDLHSDLSTLSKDDLKKRIDEKITESSDFIKKSKWLIITWGTSIVYELKSQNQIVANCHKIPSNQFNKRLLTHEEIVLNFNDFLKLIPSNTQIILAISPVRHIKETIELNNVSKSILRIASHNLSVQHENVHYFPSFEIMMDDLRDYRFYKKDMIHPNEQAIEYIWDKFGSTFFDSSVLDFVKQWQKIQSALMHKAFQPTSNKHQDFLKKTLAKLIQLREVVNVDKEIEVLKSQMI